MTCPLTHFHAVLVGEDGMEFGAGTNARSREQAAAYFEEQYPESRVVQIESPEDTARREKAMHDHIAAGGDWDEEGRPIFHQPREDEDELECSECGWPIDRGSLCEDCAEEL